MQIKISDKWLETIGRKDLRDVWLAAKLDESASLSNMGNCYVANDPNRPRELVVFECRGIEVKG